jgi:N-acetylneuraminate synthase/N,N'-diacetyllegionaminate synthase
VTGTHPAGVHVTTDAAGFAARIGDGPGADHILSGAFYVVAPDDLRRDRSFVMPGRTEAFAVPPEHSVDVDEPIDLELAEMLARDRPIRQVVVAGHELGSTSTFVIAEGGVNHDGDVEIAHRLVDAAADTGASAVKFQTFDPQALVSSEAPTAAYQRTAGEGATQRDMLARLALPSDAWAGLQEHATDRGLVFLSTPFDDASANLLDRLDVPAFKVGSGELTNIPFLERLARRGRPMLVSTGMADMLEVATAVDAIAAAGDPPLALLHCVSAYPADADDANLNAIATLRSAFGVPTGWSDHTSGMELPVAAVALGAAIVEKHLTLDRGRAGPDHQASIEPAGFAAMVAAIRTTERALGSGVKQPTAAERAIAAVARRSLHWAHALPAGTVAASDHFVALRPGTGISPASIGSLVGRRTARAAESGAIVDPADFEAPT